MTEERTQYTTQRYAELESKIADSAPDELTQLRKQIAELEATVARLEADKRRMIAQIPYEDLRYIINSHPNLRVDLRIEAKRWLDTVKVQHD